MPLRKAILRAITNVLTHAVAVFDAGSNFLHVFEDPTGAFPPLCNVSTLWMGTTSFHDLYGALPAHSTPNPDVIFARVHALTKIPEYKGPLTSL